MFWAPQWENGQPQEGLSILHLHMLEPDQIDVIWYNRYHPSDWPDKIYIYVTDTTDPTGRLMYNILYTMCWDLTKISNLIWSRVAKCQIFYKEKNLWTKFYPKKNALIATILVLLADKTNLPERWLWKTNINKSKKIEIVFFHKKLA